MKVWTAVGFKDIEVGTRVFVGNCGSGHSVLGEYATLTKVLSKNLLFTTDSGAIVKTAIDNLCDVRGKAKKIDLFVSLHLEREFIKKSYVIDLKYA